MDTEAINGMLEMIQVWEQYIGEPIKKHKVQCPFHSEKTPSMHLYEHSFHCFGCGTSGDIIKFVQLYFNVDFRAALMRLDYDFHLGLNLGQQLTSRERRKMHLESQERQERKRTQRESREAAERLYWALWDEWIRLDKNQVKYTPNNQDEELHPLFVEALHKKPYQEYLIDSLL